MQRLRLTLLVRPGKNARRTRVHLRFVERSVLKLELTENVATLRDLPQEEQREADALVRRL